MEEAYYDLLWGDDEWSEQILKLDNELMNIWIRAYYKRYWVEEHPTLSEKWQKEIIDECKQYSMYFSDNDYPNIKDELILSNKECSVLEHVLENYSGLRGFDIGCIINDCLDNKEAIENYKTCIIQTGKFP